MTTARSAEACVREASRLLEKHEMVSAVALLTQAIALRPDDADAYFLRGKALLAMGDAKAASEDMRRALELDPQRVAGISGQYGL